MTREELGPAELNAMLNLYGPNGEIQFEADREAAHQYFLQHVNNNTVFFHDLEEKLDYLVKNEYYERETLDQYTMNFIRELYNRAYKKKFRFETFLGAFKFYTSYTLKTFDGKRFLERYEDRVCMVALHLARGDEQLALQMVDEIIEGRFQPATPTFLNAGKRQRGGELSPDVRRTGRPEYPAETRWACRAERCRGFDRPAPSATRRPPRRRGRPAPTAAAPPPSPAPPASNRTG